MSFHPTRALFPPYSGTQYIPSIACSNSSEVNPDCARIPSCSCWDAVVKSPLDDAASSPLMPVAQSGHLDALPRQEVRARLFGDYRRRCLWGERTFDRVLEEGCTRKWPDAEFIVASPTRPASLTYRELHAEARRLAGALHA